MKETAQRIFRNTLAAIDIPETLARKLDRRGSHIRAGQMTIGLHDYREIVAIAFGKAALAMADGLAQALPPEYQIDGILVVSTEPKRELRGWTTFAGGHPVPNEQSFKAGEAILSRLARCNDRSLVFFLISGGGSAMVEQSLDAAATLDDFQKLNEALVGCGAPIEEINVIRKHLSAIKGGRLAAAAPRSMKITFAISDVPLRYEAAIASGPTVPDPSTVADTERIAHEYNLLEKLPASIRRVFDQHRLAETPKRGDPAFERAQFELLLGEHDLFHAAHRVCEAEGYACVCDWTADNLPVERAADQLVSLVEAEKSANPDHRIAVLADGEVNSPVTGDGLGGRNAAFVLACVPKIAEKKITILSAGTDGVDGNSPAAGAVANGESLSRARQAGLDPADFLRRCDSYTFFARIDDAIITGPTGNNLRDLRILLAD